jgi:hypothetical protein
MSTQTESNNFLYFIVGGLVIALAIFSYFYFYKGDHNLFGTQQQTGVDLKINGNGVSGTITTPATK